MANGTSGSSGMQVGFGLPGDFISQMIGGSSPNAEGMTNTAIDQFYQGLGPDELAAIKRITALGDKATPAQKKKLASLTQRGQANAILPKEISALQTNLPQFQNIANQYLQGQTKTLANLAQSTTNQLDPSYYGVQNALGQQIQSSIGQGLSPEQTNYFSQQLNAQQAAKGMYDSPLSSENTALELTGLNMQQQQQNINNALNFPGAFPNQANGILGLGVSTSPTGESLTGGSVTPTSLQDYMTLFNSIQGLNYGNNQNFGNAVGSGVQSGLNSIASILTGMPMGGGTGANMGTGTGLVMP